MSGNFPELETSRPNRYSESMIKKMFRKLFFWLPPIGWAGAIFALSYVSSPPKAPGYPFDDKVAHFLIYAILAMLIYRGLTQERGLSPARARWMAFLFTTLYGALDEFQQLFVPTRTAEIADWIADMVGAAVVFLTCLARTENRKVKPSS